jgi:hypothetical protein
LRIERNGRSYPVALFEEFSGERYVKSARLWEWTALSSEEEVEKGSYLSESPYIDRRGSGTKDFVACVDQCEVLCVELSTVCITIRIQR